MFRFLLPVQRRQRSDYSENQSNVAQLIIRLVTNHVLLIIIIRIESQIYSKLKLTNFRFISKNAWIISQVNHSAIRNLRTLTSAINQQNRSLFSCFVVFAKVHVPSVSGNRSDLLIFLQRFLRVVQYDYKDIIIIIIIRYELGLDRPAPASSNSPFQGFPSDLLPFGP